MATSHHVLIIEDDEWLAELFRTTLEKQQFDVTVAHNALEGMAAIGEQLPAVIILDFFMPGPNAMVLLHELQSYSDTAKVPVVLCTNSASDISAPSVEPYGVKVVLDKTLMEPDDIVAAVRRVV